jgi:phosphatidylserine/phosphatidylglycerophosphate/cardiolipin synthase-like enzyme
MAKKIRSRKISVAASDGAVVARAYTSPTLVLLAMDWPDGKKFGDFLGFSILRSPGFHPGEKDGFLFNKISFSAPTEDSQPLPSNLAPFQKFMWWDAGINDADRGKTFNYKITPVRGTGPNDLTPVAEAATTVTARLPDVEENGISTWFNRAVVSSQSFSRKFPDPEKQIDDVMKWLANGLQDSFPKILAKADKINGAIYHLTDKEWVMPSLKGFKGELSLVYEDRKNDQTDAPAVKQLKSAHFEGKGRSKTNIMHDKFLVDTKNQRVLMGSANFTPEGLTYQANLLHIFNSPKLAQLYSKRQLLLRGDPTVANTAADAAWSSPIKVGKATVRVFFSPEPKNKRVSIDTVIKAVKAAKSSVMFCMFDPTDGTLIRSLLATGDRGKLLFGMLNSISDPSKTKKNKKDNLSDSGEAPRAPTEATKVKVELFHRSRKDKKVLAYSYFRPGNSPAGFLPEFSTVDLSSRSTLPPPKPGKKGGPPAVHIHHKFIIIDADTDKPTIYTGSANLSANSTNHNDENLLEITNSPALARTYLAEFMRIYEHYRARALWNIAHPAAANPAKGGSRASKNTRLPPSSAKRIAQTFTLKKTRDAWVRDAYKRGTPAFLERQTLARL